MEVLRSYVVRLYREDAEGITGVIEAVGTGEARPFRSADELWRALHAGDSRKRLRSINPHQEEDT